MNKFWDYAETEIVCERKVTERGRERAEEIKKWLNGVLSRDEVLGVVGWIQQDCKDPTWETPMFIVFVKRGMLPVDNDDPFEAARYYDYEAVKNPCPGIVWSVEEVDEMPEFSEDDIEEICWCGIVESFTVWGGRRW